MLGGTAATIVVRENTEFFFYRPVGDARIFTVSQRPYNRASINEIRRF